MHCRYIMMKTIGDGISGFFLSPGGIDGVILKKMKVKIEVIRLRCTLNII